MPSVEELYQEIILEHNKHPRNFGQLHQPTHFAHGNNPLCGDEISVQLKLLNGIISEVNFSGQGCAISRASASMMTEAVAGKSPREAVRIAEKLINAMQQKDQAMNLQADGDLASLEGVRKFPARIKCATLGWHALIAALQGKKSVSTEPTH